MENFTIIQTPIKDLVILEPKVYADKRGYFFEVHNDHFFKKNGLNYCFVQDNESKSTKGVLRGLHFQKKYPQAKLVRVIQGEVFDVAVDLRSNSSTYGKWYGTILSGTNKKQMMIPRGFAHGFMVLSDEALFTYKCDDFYHPEDEGGIMYNDPNIAVDWPKLDNVLISDKDSKLPLLKDCKFSF